MVGDGTILAQLAGFEDRLRQLMHQGKIVGEESQLARQVLCELQSELDGLQIGIRAMERYLTRVENRPVTEEELVATVCGHDCADCIG